MRCKQCNDELAITERYYCNRCHGWLIESAPAQEEKEMITCKHGERNDDESCWNCKIENEDLAAELRERWDMAFCAALTGLSSINGVSDDGIVHYAGEIAKETIRRHADMMAARDKLIAQVVG